MRSDIGHTIKIDQKRDVSILQYPTATWAGIAAGAPEGIANDLTMYVDSCQQTSKDARLVLRWHQELAALPSIGTIVQIVDNVDNFVWWAGVLEAYDSITESRGTRSATVTLRSRDSLPLWQQAKFVSNSYPSGVDLFVLARSILTGLGLTEAEYPETTTTGFYTPHSTTQLADMSAWEMLEVIYQAVGLDPYVDALGRFKPVSRDIVRPITRQLLGPEVVSVGGTKARPGTTSVILSWLDKNLAISTEQVQSLGSATITSGYFQFEQIKRIYWSKDGKQRAKDTWMKINQSANTLSLVPASTEDYAQVNEYCGEIQLRSLYWGTGLLVASLYYLYVLAQQPDLVDMEAAVTIPVGRKQTIAALIVIMFVMMSLGTGNYEIMGTPYDYVHAVNKTEAYSATAQVWNRVEEEISNDFINDQGHSEVVAQRELIYRALSSSPSTLVVADDPRYERGDIVGFPTGGQLYLLDYRRDLTRGKDAVVTLTGFLV